jgi:hypothetical protein
MSHDTTTTRGPWGPYHDHIGEGLAHCADYLGASSAPWPARSPPTATTSEPRPGPCATRR